MFYIVSVVLISSLLSFILGFRLYKFLKFHGLFDQPNSRSSHSVPTVRGGGIIVIFPFLGALFFVSVTTKSIEAMGLAAGLIMVSVISSLDDIRSISKFCRFGFHVGGALVFLSTVFYSLWIAGDLVANPVVLAGVGILLALWVVGYANAFNFMDGINGLAGAQAVLTSFFDGAVSVIFGGWNSEIAIVCGALCGGALGFLPHNFPRAKMFMGDIGSVTLGFGLAGVVVWIASRYGWWLMIPLSLSHANFVLDTGFTLLRRVLRGGTWSEPHREHFYQYMIRSGASHVSVTLCQAVLQIIVISLLLLWFMVGLVWKAAILALVFVIWFSYFAYCEKTYGKCDE